MIYALIMYCTGFCPAELIGPPSDVLLFTSYADCQEELKKYSGFEMNPNPLPGSPIKTGQKETCARVFADPKQLDRLLRPDQLGRMLKDYEAHPDGYKPWRPAGCEGKTICLPTDMIGPCGKGMDFGCLFKQKSTSGPLNCFDAVTKKPTSCEGNDLKDSHSRLCATDYDGKKYCVPVEEQK